MCKCDEKELYSVKIGEGSRQYPITSFYDSSGETQEVYGTKDRYVWRIPKLFVQLRRKSQPDSQFQGLLGSTRMFILLSPAYFTCTYYPLFLVRVRRLQCVTRDKIKCTKYAKIKEQLRNKSRIEYWDNIVSRKL